MRVHDLEVLAEVRQIVLLNLAGQSGDTSWRDDQSVARAIFLYLIAREVNILTKLLCVKQLCNRRMCVRKP